MDASTLRAQLCQAIARRSLIMFQYADLIRVVEPHRFGINSAGNEMLSGWLLAGYSRSDPQGGWRNYLMTDIHDFQLLDAPFASARPGYAAEDTRMREVYCQLGAEVPADVPARGPFVVRESSAVPAPNASSGDSPANPHAETRATGDDATGAVP